MTTARLRARGPIVLKLGGELLEQPVDVARVARGIVALGRTAPVLVVHGGGREIDAALAAAGIPKRQVDGLRVTDGPTLGVVVGVLAGTLNTRLVAALRQAGGRPVGLTGADAGVAVARKTAPITTVAGTRVDLELVGTPVAGSDASLLRTLLRARYIPVVACIGATRRGDLLNVNADTLASHLAAALGARRLVIAGGTPGVFDGQGRTIARLTSRDASRLVRNGVANKGMVAKLDACRAAVRAGVGDVLIVDGRQTPFETLAAARDAGTTGTQVMR